jgi:hypothetical protein
MADSAHIHHRSLRLNLPAHQLERLRNGDHILHPRRHLQGFDLVSPSIAHRGHDGPLHSTRNVRLVARLANALDHVRNLLFGCFL